MISAEALAEMIAEAIRAEFDEKHLSGNLVDTMTVARNADGDWEVRVPAPDYDVTKFVRKGVIAPTGKGSYASALDEEGSDFHIGRRRISPRNHIGFVDECVGDAIARWLHEGGLAPRAEVRDGQADG